MGTNIGQGNIVEEQNMELQIISKNLDVKQEIKDYVQKKINRLVRYLPSIDDVKVEIGEEKTRIPEHRFIVQITVRNRGTLLRGEEKSSTVNQAVDMVTEILARQIKRYKGKFNRKGKGGASRSVTETPAGIVTGVDVAPEVVKIKNFAVKEMSIEESAEQMELLGHDFFLFINNENGTLNLIYKRKDGNYGLIIPELA